MRDREGGLEFERAHGPADRAHGTATTPDTRLAIEGPTALYRRTL